MNEIKELKTNLQFFKFTGLLTDIPSWFWDFEYQIGRTYDCWKAWQRSEYTSELCYVNDLHFGDYIVLIPTTKEVRIYTEEQLKKDFEVIE